MANSTILRWGLLSTARINRSLIGPIRSSENSQLKAVASRSESKAEAFARLWGIPTFYTDYEALLSDPEIDVIYNPLPNSLHAEWSIKALQMGKHVLCEKPITTSSRDIDAVINVAKETGRIICEAFMYRHHPQTIRVKQIVDNGEIGNIQIIRGSFCYTNNRSPDVRFDPNLGGGCLWDVGSYPVSYARNIVGSEPVTVFGHQIIGYTGVDILFTGQMQFPGETIAYFESSFISPYKVIIEITGDKGRIIIPEPYKPGERTKIIIEREGKAKTYWIKGEELYFGEVKDIENAILFGKAPKISLEDSRANILTIEALFKSARLSQPVNI